MVIISLIVSVDFFTAKFWKFSQRDAKNVDILCVLSVAYTFLCGYILMVYRSKIALIEAEILFALGKNLIDFKRLDTKRL